MRFSDCLHLTISDYIDVLSIAGLEKNTHGPAAEAPSVVPGDQRKCHKTCTLADQA